MAGQRLCGGGDSNLDAEDGVSIIRIENIEDMGNKRGQKRCLLTTRGLSGIEDHDAAPFISDPDDQFGLGPTVREMIANGETERVFDKRPVPPPVEEERPRPGLIPQITDDCQRDNCRISFSDAKVSTPKSWTPTYDKAGALVNDPRLTAQFVVCSTCKRRWILNKQKGITVFGEIDGETIAPDEGI